MRSYEAAPVSDGSYHLGEGPLWDPVRGRLLWVDILAGAVLWGVLDAGRVRVAAAYTVDDSVGAVACADDGRLLVAGRQRLLHTDPAAIVLDTRRVIERPRTSRLNDGGCDPAGRFLVGSMALDGRSGQEVLCRLDDDGRIMVIDDDLTVSNGLAWSPDGSSFYSIDTEPGTVWVRDYDVGSGRVGPRTPMLTVRDGKPDGMCTDADGNLWIALFGAGEVACFSPSGQPLATVRVDVPNPTSVAFVGDDLGTLLITTARHELPPDQLAALPDAGRLFAADVGVQGAPVALWDGVWVPTG